MYEWNAPTEEDLIASAPDVWIMGAFTADKAYLTAEDVNRMIAAGEISMTPVRIAGIDL